MAKLFRVEPTAAHIDHVARNMREIDRYEIFAAHGDTPWPALKFAVSRSKMVWAIVTDTGEPLALIGASSRPWGEGAFGWMLGTDKISEYPLAFARITKKCVEELAKEYGVLTNRVAPENTTTLKWLKWVGATFFPEQPYGLLQKPFIKFEVKHV